MQERLKRGALAAIQKETATIVCAGLAADREPLDDGSRLVLVALLVRKGKAVSVLGGG